jgi:hypothetical protein
MAVAERGIKLECRIRKLTPDDRPGEDVKHTVFWLGREGV